eukprot:TRINITY_DN11809_c0_g1_i5.p1 TRINITY_DN11809_c0_g1~~TRINITY_DN11809_c0_g1_i5.p1  ORF type:complete len:814 (+),score=144.43 TRINITY_DN11809_c0_g1_i5:64-2505(+)
MELVPNNKLILAATAVGATVASYVCYRVLVPKGEKTFFSTFSGEDHPKTLCCPITYELMEDPVITADGHTFEREAIVHWLQEHNTSPVTGLPLPDLQIRPNHALRAELSEYRERHKLPPIKALGAGIVENARAPTDAAITTVLYRGRVLRMGQMAVPAGYEQQQQQPQQQQQGQRQQQTQQAQAQAQPQPRRQIQIRINQNRQAATGRPAPSAARAQHGTNSPGAPNSNSQQGVGGLSQQEAQLTGAQFYAEQIGLDLSGMNYSLLQQWVALTLQQPAFATTTFLRQLRQQPQLDVPSNNIAQWILGCPLAMHLLMQRLAAMGPVQFIRTYALLLRSLSSVRVATEIDVPETLCLDVMTDNVEGVRRYLSEHDEAHRHLVPLACLAIQHDARAALALLDTIQASVRVTPQDTPVYRCCELTSRLGHAIIGGQLSLARQMVEDRPAIVNQPLTKPGIVPLLAACYLGHVEIVKLLLDHGANTRPMPQASALSIAAAAGHLPCCKALIDHERAPGGRFPIEASTLRLACEHNHLPVVKHLVEEGAQVEDALLASAVRFEDLFEYLLQKGADPNVRVGMNEPLTHLTLIHDYRAAFELLLEYGVDVNQAAQQQHTALHLACMARKPDYAQLLIQHDGCNLEAKTSNSSTPLILAAWSGDAEIARLLLGAGADLFAQTDDGDTSLHQAAFHGHGDVIMTLLHHADAQRPLPEHLVPNWWGSLAGTQHQPLRFIDMRKYDGTTALHIAAVRGHTATVQALLQHGARKEVGVGPIQTRVVIDRARHRWIWHARDQTETIECCKCSSFSTTDIRVEFYLK